MLQLKLQLIDLAYGKAAASSAAQALLSKAKNLSLKDRLLTLQLCSAALIRGGQSKKLEEELTELLDYREARDVLGTSELLYLKASIVNARMEQKKKKEASLLARQIVEEMAGDNLIESGRRVDILTHLNPVFEHSSWWLAQLQKELKDKRSVYQENELSIVRLLTLAAQNYEASGDIRKAFDSYLQAYQINTRLEGDDSSRYLRLVSELEQLRDLSQKKNDAVSALKYQGELDNLKQNREKEIRKAAGATI